MSEDEGDRPRASGIRSYFKPVSVAQSRVQHYRIVEKQAVNSPIQSAQDETFRASKPALCGRGRPHKVPKLAQRWKHNGPSGGLVLGRAWTRQLMPNMGSLMHFMHCCGVGELPEA
jgi:hypothetical protein